MTGEESEKAEALLISKAGVFPVFFMSSVTLQ